MMVDNELQEKKKKSKKKTKESKKIESLEASIAAEKEKSKDYLNRLKYLQADFENYRKRIEKNLHSIKNSSNVKLITGLLNIIDDLEKAVDEGKKTQNSDALREGVEMVYKNLLKLIEREGAEEIKAIGHSFDPEIHEVLIMVPTKSFEAGTIIEEVRKGFMFKGKVIRPSIVNVAKKLEGEEE